MGYVHTQREPLIKKICSNDVFYTQISENHTDWSSFFFLKKEGEILCLCIENFKSINSNVHIQIALIHWKACRHYSLYEQRLRKRNGFFLNFMLRINFTENFQLISFQFITKQKQQQKSYTPFILCCQFTENEFMHDTIWMYAVSVHCSMLVEDNQPDQDHNMAYCLGYCGLDFDTASKIHMLMNGIHRIDCHSHPNESI